MIRATAPPPDVRVFQTEAPVPVVALARRLGLKVYDEETNAAISGRLVRDTARGGPSGYAVYVNGAHHRNRKRFTLAHEIAHFLLHRHLLEAGIVEDDALYRSHLSNAIESEANRMAAEILMPWHLIDQAIDQGITAPADLASLFQVSETAMRIRLGLPT
ncbi:ImmA/IrrE family metallo-endopeptidase [Tistrella bauzanensis]|nr:ImmA/IrrE family metallo-endopeptidase [Tistrella bauzanensis]